MPEKGKSPENQKKYFFSLIIKLFLGKERAENLQETFRLKPKQRILIIIGFILTFILYFLYDTYKEPFQEKLRNPKEDNKDISFSEKKNDSLKILILNFKSLTTKDYMIEEAIDLGLSNLKEQENLKLKILYDSISYPPKTPIESINIGKYKNADIVIYGVLDSKSNNYKINLQVVKKIELPKGFDKKSKFKKNLYMPNIANLEALRDEKFIIYYLLSIISLNENKCKEGSEFLQKAFDFVNNENSEIFLSKSVISQSYLNFILCLSEKKDYSSFLELTNKALEIDSTNNEVRFGKAYYYLNELNDKGKAKKEFDIIEKNKPLISEIHYATYLTNSYMSFSDSDVIRLDKYLKKAELYEKANNTPPIGSFFLELIKGNFSENIELLKYFYFQNDQVSQFIKDFLRSYVLLFEGNLEDCYESILQSEKSFKKLDEESLNYIYDLYNSFKLGINKGTPEISLYDLAKNKIELNEPINREVLIFPFLLKDKKDYKLLKKYIKIKLEKNPNFKKHFNFNDLYPDRIVKINDSINIYKNKIKKDPNDYASLAKLSNSYNQLGNIFNSQYYEHKALNGNINSVAFLDFGTNELNLNSEKERNLFSRKELSYYRKELKNIEHILSLDSLNLDVLLDRIFILNELSLITGIKPLVDTSYKETQRIYDLVTDNSNKEELLSYMINISILKNDFKNAIRLLKEDLKFMDNKSLVYFEIAQIYLLDLKNVTEAESNLNLAEKYLNDINIQDRKFKFEINRLKNILKEKKLHVNNVYN